MSNDKSIIKSPGVIQRMPKMSKSMLVNDIFDVLGH